MSPSGDFGPDGLGQAEVEHLDRAIRPDLDVGWLQITVHDAAVVRDFEGVRHLRRDPRGLVEWQRPVDEPVGERLTLDEFQHQRRHAPGAFETVNGCDAGMVQRRQHLGFALKSGQSVGIPDESRSVGP